MSDVLVKPGQEELIAQLLELHGQYMHATRLAEARRNLIPFCHHLMADFRSPAHIRAIADLLERAERGEVSRIIITMPPRHGKTRIISNLFPAWYFGRNPGSEVIFTTYNQDLAEDNGRYVKNTIASDEFKEVFPDVRIRNDSASARRFSTYQKGNYFAVGVGGPLTGRGAKLLIIDDPLKNREEAESSSIRQALIDWYTSTAYTRLAPGGIVIIVQTRWHTEDLAGVALKQDHEGWVHLDLPAILDERAASFLGREPGTALWPEQFDLDTLLRTKKSVPARDWASLYMQSPVSQGGNIIKRSQVQDWTDPEPPYCDFIVASFDTAFGTKATNDPTAYTVWGLFHDAQGVRHTILLDAKQKRVEFPELKKWIVDVDTRHSPDIILVENKASGQSLLQEMRRLQVPVQAYNPGRQDKVARLEACTPLFENGKIWAPLNRDYANEWIEQLVTFPAGKHDDLVDSTTAALTRLRRFGDLTTTLDYEPEDEDGADENRAVSYW
jgi:predicted phage terminase large subunit-like protein